MEQNFSVLDNPVLSALLTDQSKLGATFGGLKAFLPQYTPFGAFFNEEHSAADLDRFAESSNKFYIFSDTLPKHSSQIQYTGMFEILQMVAAETPKPEPKNNIRLLNGRFDEELFALMMKFYPEYFRKSTVEMGNYYGIFAGGKLAAVAGERMHTGNFREVSAVVTAEEFRGRGLAKELVNFAANTICSRGETAFLHADGEKKAAVALYESLGFSPRKSIKVFGFRR